MAKKKSAKGGKREVVIVSSKMKDAIRKGGCNTSGDAINDLNDKVHAMIAAACARAKDNGRKTVRGYDF
jgi:hypothetical protein